MLNWQSIYGLSSFSFIERQRLLTLFYLTIVKEKLKFLKNPLTFTFWTFNKNMHWSFDHKASSSTKS